MTHLAETRRILIAPNAFKGCLSAMEVCHHLSRGIRSVCGDTSIETVPLADGGDGTLEVMVGLWNGHLREFEVEDPLGRPVKAPIGFDPKEEKGVIEMARASGLALLKENERNPLKTTSRGTGQLIRAAIESGVSEIYLGIGGSGTNDGGAGMGSALGFEHRDASGNEVLPTGGNLNRIVEIRPPRNLSNLHGVRVTVLCDVTNPLCGENGASWVYGPQKGASREEVPILDSHLAHLSRVWARDLRKRVEDVPGAGAAGGMGAGAMVYLDASLVSGTDVLFSMTRIEERIRTADLVITGEGALDRTSLEGKIPGRVAQLSKKHGKPCLGVCGKVSESAPGLFQTNGFTDVLEIAPPGTSIEERIRGAPKWLSETGREIGKRFSA